MKELVLGGARSGKSQYAESQALSYARQGSGGGKSLYYIATGCAGDKEMAARIEHHRSRRDKIWHVIEEPIHLTETLLSLNQKNNIVVVDCLTLFISNLLSLRDSAVSLEETQALTDAIPDLVCDLFVVSNEVGSGIVPLGQLTREFVDRAGWLHQSLAKICNKVTLLVAGLPMTLKSEV